MERESENTKRNCLSVRQCNHLELHTVPRAWSRASNLHVVVLTPQVARFLEATTRNVSSGKPVAYTEIGWVSEALTQRTHSHTHSLAHSVACLLTKIRTPTHSVTRLFHARIHRPSTHTLKHINLSTHLTTCLPISALPRSCCMSSRTLL